MVACSTIWCVLLAIASPMNVVSSGPPNRISQLMAISSLLRDEADSNPQLHQPSEDSQEKVLEADIIHPRTMVESEADNPAKVYSKPKIKNQRKRKFSDVGIYHPRKDKTANLPTTPMNTRRDSSVVVGSSSSTSLGVVGMTGTGTGQLGNIQGNSEIMNRVKSILNGGVEDVPGQPFDPYSNNPECLEQELQLIKFSCSSRVDSPSVVNLAKKLTRKFSIITFEISTILKNASEKPTTLWHSRNNKMVPNTYIARYIGKNNIIVMVYRESSEKKLQSKFLLIPGVLGYDCSYYKEHFKRKYDFVKLYAIPHYGDAQSAMFAFLVHFAKFSAEFTIREQEMQSNHKA
ncbi:hypothetical protein IWQ61_009694 [Dispira simplex]|nr:hypothetical protein IWQ61_009694 [Dispira simplex]